MKIVSIVGARPQFIKAAVVSRALQRVAGLQEVVLHTGQHYDERMSEVFFRELGMARPDRQLGIGSGSHGAQTGRMLEAIEATLLEEAPDWVLVYGDTNSTLAGALAAAKLKLPIAHVEAGLRSFNRHMAEEINRTLTDQLSTLLFVPTQAARTNLEREGLPRERIHTVGDVMYDAALHFGHRAATQSTILESLALSPKSYVLATIHRAENTDDATRLNAIFDGLALIAGEHPVVLPLHPRTRKALSQAGRLQRLPASLHLIDPVGYLDMIRLVSNAALVATDSGGVQKEAFFHRVPCATLRDETEWAELIKLGWNRLVPPESAERVASGLRAARGRLGEPGEPYGRGDAAQAIARALAAGPRP